MNSSRIVTMIITVGSTVLLSACDMVGLGEEWPAPYVIEVEAVTYNSPVTSQDTLKVRFRGMAATNGCGAFWRKDVGPFPHGAAFRFWGRSIYGGDVDACDDVLVAMDVTHEIPNPEPGHFMIVIRQPNGDELEVLIPVGEP